MTYNVFGGTLNLAESQSQVCLLAISDKIYLLDVHENITGN